METSTQTWPKCGHKKKEQSAIMRVLRILALPVIWLLFLVDYLISLGSVSFRLANRSLKCTECGYKRDKGLIT